MKELSLLQKKNIKYVITGQQVGLLGGPLYTIYKILHAYHLAQKLNAEPVFWMELNDADFHEINHLYVLDGKSEVVKVQWDSYTDGRRVGDVIVDDQAIAALKSFLKRLNSPLKDEFQQKIFDIYKPGQKLRDVAHELMQFLLGDIKIRLFDPMQDEFLSDAQDILRKELERTQPGEQFNGFALIEGRREALFRENNGFFTRKGKRVDPEKHILLPNFRTRPIIQDAFFPDAVYIAGPNEMVYLSELSALYEYHGVTQSQLVPRRSFILIKSKDIQFLNEFGFSPEDFEKMSVNQLFQRVVESGNGYSPDLVRTEAETARSNFIDSLRKLNLDTKNLDYMTRKLLKEALGQMKKEFKTKYAHEFNRIKFLKNFVYPLQKPQERVYSLVFMELYFNKPDLIHNILNAFESENKIVEI